LLVLSPNRPKRSPLAVADKAERVKVEGVGVEDVQDVEDAAAMEETEETVAEDERPDPPRPPPLKSPQIRSPFLLRLHPLLKPPHRPKVSSQIRSPSLLRPYPLLKPPHRQTAPPSPIPLLLKQPPLLPRLMSFQPLSLCQMSLRKAPKSLPARL
jgi:hypothetical protein